MSFALLAYLFWMDLNKVFLKSSYYEIYYINMIVRMPELNSLGFGRVHLVISDIPISVF